MAHEPAAVLHLRLVGRIIAPSVLLLLGTVHRVTCAEKKTVHKAYVQNTCVQLTVNSKTMSYICDLY